MSISPAIPEIAGLATDTTVDQGSGTVDHSAPSLEQLGAHEASQDGSKSEIAPHSSRKTLSTRVALPPTFEKALGVKGALHLAFFLPLRDGVRLAFLCRQFQRVRLQRVAAETRIAASDFVPVGPRQRELVPKALHLLGHCWGSALRALDLSGCDFLSNAMLQRFMSGLWELLVELKLVGCKLVSDVGIQSVCDACHNLESISLAGMELITDLSMTYLTTGCLSLHQISIGRCPNVTDEGLETLAVSSLQLHVLDLHWTPLITDEGLRMVSAGCQRLHVLNMARCLQLTDRGLHLIAENCFELRELNVGELNYIVSDWGLRPVIEASKQLQVLKMRRNGSDVCLASAAFSCCQLRELDVSDCCQNVTDVGLQVLSAGCQLLVTFSAENCFSITGTGIEVLALGCRSLRFVNLSRCPNVGDAGITAIASSCPKLEQLDLCHCDSVTDLGISALGTKCCLLRGLVLSHCRLVTDTGILSLASGCPLLSELNLFHCDLISNVGCLALAEKCGSLHTLQIDGCSSVTFDGLEAMRHFLYAPPGENVVEPTASSEGSESYNGSSSSRSGASRKSNNT